MQYDLNKQATNTNDEMQFKGVGAHGQKDALGFNLSSALPSPSEVLQQHKNNAAYISLPQDFTPAPENVRHC